MAPGYASTVRRTAPLLVILLVAGCFRGDGGLGRPDHDALLDGRGAGDAVLRSAKADVLDGRGGEAFDKLVRRFRDGDGDGFGEDRDVALWLAADALVEDGRRLRAFFYLDELLDTYPGSDLYLPAARRQFEIADSYLDGEPDRWLFLSEGMGGDALEMLFRVQLRAPGSDLAEAALLRTGEHYFERGDYDFAEDVYTVFLDRFPRSPSVPAARLRQAASNLLQYEGPAYDPTPLLDAREQFARFAADYPGRAEAARLAEVLAYVEEQLGKKREIKAGFYDRTRRPEAARLLRGEAEAAS